MSVHNITIQLPADIYRRVAQRSKQNQRSIKEEIIATVQNKFQAEDEGLAPDIAQALAELDHLTDSELWQAAQLDPFPELTDELQALFDKQQREGLTEQEQERTGQIVQFFERSTLIRAKSAALLKSRGHSLESLLAHA